MSRDRMLVERIAVFAHHGVLPEEERMGQRFMVSLAARLDLAPAGRSDDLARSVNYAELVDLAVRVATGRRFRLIEALAEAIAAEVLAAFPPIEEITVRIDKPSAPVSAITDGIAVEITRGRGE
ncbi:dihydroneopterin aldolase [Enterovirga sp.]|uniref:dihydroneopterin aldolase n=1 Tax=Enterovirga sp. TaxID=2026350 RepID=UPI002635AA72|nr:dihydroneopterin aldolase [Enterovirga sp.]MDB5590066.1 folB [Enterovirga sp.]